MKSHINLGSVGNFPGVEAWLQGAPGCCEPPIVVVALLRKDKWLPQMPGVSSDGVPGVGTDFTPDIAMEDLNY